MLEESRGQDCRVREIISLVAAAKDMVQAGRRTKHRWRTDLLSIRATSFHRCLVKQTVQFDIQGILRIRRTRPRRYLLLMHCMELRSLAAFGSPFHASTIIEIGRRGI